MGTGIILFWFSFIISLSISKKGIYTNDARTYINGLCRFGLDIVMNGSYTSYIACIDQSWVVSTKRYLILTGPIHLDKPHHLATTSPLPLDEQSILMNRVS